MKIAITHGSFLHHILLLNINYNFLPKYIKVAPSGELIDNAAFLFICYMHVESLFAVLSTDVVRGGKVVYFRL